MQYCIRGLMVLMAVLPPIAGWLWYAHNVPLLQPAGLELFGFEHHVSGKAATGYDLGAIAVALAMMGLAVMAAMAISRSRPA